jgi:hypothetical protein
MLESRCNRHEVAGPLALIIGAVMSAIGMFWEFDLSTPKGGRLPPMANVQIRGQLVARVEVKFA